jgi:hypothetical protein
MMWNCALQHKEQRVYMHRGLFSRVMSSPIEEERKGVRYAGLFMIVVGFIYFVLVLRRFYLGLFDIWTLFTIVFCVSFILFGEKLLKGKVWAAVGGIAYSLFDFAVFLHFDVSEPLMHEVPFQVLFRESIWILVFIIFVLEIVVVVLIVRNWSEIRQKRL